MTLPELLEACGHAPELRFLLIGGHAVIAHGYPRTTFDVDLLIRRSQSVDWVEMLRKLGYAIDQEREAFLQFKPPAGAEPVDLMMVNEATFEGMWLAAVARSVGGQQVKIPCLDHLLALKLHVLKQNLGHRVIKDLDDVIRLVLTNKLDVRSDHYVRLFEKYGTREDYQRVLQATSRP